ncbi:transcriptional regulator MntR [Virgibacillus sp. NKC19-3]|uniref:transcriptional regulator MntR n=1 Tax=Virgibacillus saliphilus TaxID=2831674 RepID=UPI001C9B273A|nr:transcriptional regulator MntR [Virgibacillus sp. NKC19-3]MBY7141999.1 transcriptional regulator MntR [Virgibacillus sp. NKC19-3]
MLTPKRAYYLENIYILMEEKGYARAADIAIILDVTQSSVTRMLQKLDEEGLGIYEKHRGFALTPNGKKLGKALVEKHEMVEGFLRTIGVQEKHVGAEVEGIKHNISKHTTDCISDFLDFFVENPHIKESYMKYKTETKVGNKDSAG